MTSASKGAILPSLSMSGKKRGRPKDLAVALVSGTMLVGYSMGGFLAGWLLDRKVGTFPLFALSLLMLGALAAFYRLYRMLVK